MKYLCIDTNIFVQCCLLELEGDNLEVLTKLHKLLDENKLKLLLPEVIKLEFYKILEKKTEDLVNRIGKHKAAINTDSFDKKIKTDILSKLDECMADRHLNKTKVTEEIEKIFSHPNTVQNGLELKPEFFVNAYRLFLSGKKPYGGEKKIKESIQPDCLIIETIRSYFKDKADYHFFFCSQNTSDFAKNTDLSTNSQPLTIHPDLETGFGHIKYYGNLGTLLNTELSADISPEAIEKLEESKIEIPLNMDTLTETGGNPEINPPTETAEGLSVTPLTSAVAEIKP